MPHKTTSLSKITQPRFSRILLRKRLFTQLDRYLKSPAVWISGPPGSGKTILVSSYIESRKPGCLWYRIDRSDEDAASFFYYMGLAAKKAASRYRKPLPLLTPEYLPGLHPFSMRYFEDLYNRLKPPFCIVFDNFQDASNSSSFLNEVIHAGIEAIVDGISILFISRTGPPQAFSRLLVNNSMKVLGWDELALTLKECSGMVRLRLKKRQSMDLMREIHFKTKGWAAGIHLMTEKVKECILNPKQLHFMGMDKLSGYFTSEILEKLDVDRRDFLLKTSLLPVMDSEMAEELTGNRNAEKILHELNQNNCFTERRFHTNPVYQYHPLLSEFLLARVKDFFSDEEISRLQKKAALILYESEKFEDAFDLFRNLSDWEWIKRLVTEQAQELIREGREKVLEKWIMSLPREMLDTEPWLQYWLGMSLIPFNLKEGRVYLEKAFNLFRGQRDVSGVYLSWSGIVDSSTLALDNLESLDYWIPVLDELMREFGSIPSGWTETHVASSIFMALVYRQPHHPDLNLWEARALTLSQGSEEIILKALVLSTHAFNKIRAGEIQEARLAIESCRGLILSEGVPPLVVLMMRWIEAVYLTNTASHESCMNLVSDSLKLAASSGVHVMDFSLMGHGTLSALNAGNFRVAEKLLNSMAPLLLRVRPYDQGFYHFLSGYYALLHGDNKSAIKHMKLALKFALETGLPIAESICNLGMAHVMHKTGDDEKASCHLNECLRISRLIRYPYMEFLCLLTSAQFAFDRGEDEEGLTSLGKAFNLGKERVFINTYLFSEDAVARLCCRAIQAGIETEYVHNFIKRRNILPEIPPFDVEGWPWAVKLYTLGRFSILKDGRPVVFSRKPLLKPLDLLKAIIAFGGRDVREEVLIDSLWPDSEGDMAHKAFAIALHRLRKLAGLGEAISLIGGRVTLDCRYFWVDIWAFEYILGEAERTLREGQKEKAIRLLEKVADIYQGEFLGDEKVTPWVVLPRERLRKKFLKCMTKLTNLQEERGEFEKMIDLLKNGIEVDMFAEEFYQQLMTCYQRLGRRSEALAIYKSFKIILSVTPGIEPSPKTEAIYKSLISK